MTGVGVDSVFVLFGKHPYSWTPDQIGRLTIPQVKMYLNDGKRRTFGSIAEMQEERRRQRGEQ